MDYKQELNKAMKYLANKDKTIFLGQTCEYNGSPMFASLEGVDPKKRLEMPVAEDMQMGISIGLALEGFIPISIFPRIDFLICATNQLANHLNHCEEMSNGEFKPGVIVRTQIGNTEPLNPGVQHTSDYTLGLRRMCPNIMVKRIQGASAVFQTYLEAYARARNGKSTIIVELPQGGDKTKPTWEAK